MRRCGRFWTIGNGLNSSWSVRKQERKKKELTDRVFFTFSGGEKAMSMYVPLLFSAVAAKYAGAREDAPKMISLDEAFAGVDEMNIRDMFRLIVEFEFNFRINSQILWGIMIQFLHWQSISSSGRKMPDLFL